MKNIVMQDNDEVSNQEELLSNILPSYEMFQSTVSMTLTPTNENYRLDPPLYEASTSHMNNSDTISPLNTLSPYSTTDVEYSYPTPRTRNETNDNDDQPIEIWENTIIANMHNLVNLTDKNNKFSKSLDISFYVTQNICQRGVKGELYDTEKKEFTQGDYIHGYITITNNSDDDIPFDMFYVTLEGSTVVLKNDNGLIDIRKPRAVHKFLNQTDLFASSTFSNIGRFVTENKNPYDCTIGDEDVDPTDGSCLSFDVERNIKAHTTYKRFFTFLIPDKLLDDTCEEELPSHFEIVPTIGINRYMKRTTWDRGNISDLSFIDSFNSYSIHASIVGKASYYREDFNSDYYLLIKEAFQSIRVLPDSIINTDYNQSHKNKHLFYEALISSIKNKIEEGNELLDKLTKSKSLRPNLLVRRSTDSDSVKLSQLYVDQNFRRIDSKTSKKSDVSENYDTFVEIRRKVFSVPSKALGLMVFSSPKYFYTMKYVPLPVFRKSNIRYNTSISIPVKVSFLAANSNSVVDLPNIKKLNVQLVVLTIKSETIRIPIEFGHFMIRDSSENRSQSDEKPFDENVIRRFKKYLTQLNQLIKSVGADVLQVPTQIYNSVKCLANLKTKHILLDVVNPTFNKECLEDVKSIPWQIENKNPEGNLCHSKEFSINVDLNHCRPSNSKDKQYNGQFLDIVNLVPSFQNCFLARMYYFKISIKLTTGHVLEQELPINII